MMSYPHFVLAAPTNSMPQPMMVPISNSDPPPKVRRDQSYTLKETIKIPSSHPHIHQYSSPVEIDKMVKNEEHEDMTKKMKSLEQSIRDMQGLGGHKGVSFSDLCMFPHVHLPTGFKTLMFEKYDGHGDPIAHLKIYCNQLRCAEGKKRKFQYNIDIVQDLSSLNNLRKKTTENFREYAIRLREQAARVKPPMKDSEMIDVFLQAQEPDYFHYLLSVVGKTFAEVIKVGEMVENGIKSGKIVSQAALKATTQVLQNGSGNIGGKKRREDVAAIVLVPRTHVQGHNIEICWYLKRAIQDLIDSNRIIVESPSGPNINQNSLPRHTETNMLEMMKGHEEFASPYKPILKVGTGIQNLANVVDLTKKMPLGAENVLEKLSPSNTPILTVKRALEDFWAVPQLPMTNPQAVPWNYDPSVVTYKEKEIDEEKDEVGGITHSGRCYVPMELMKTKNDQIQIKSPVTEGEAEEFLRKMKLSNNSVVEQLRKTPAQISLLSLLTHSDEHRKAIMKILNEAHVPSKVIVIQLEKIAGRIFEVNRITFSDDELPKEGTRHNQGLHITIKSELSYVTRFLIEGGSGSNICPLSTLQKLNVSAERVRPNNVCVRAFDGSNTNVIGEIELIRTIGPLDIALNFLVVDINASYNLLLWRPWVNRAGAVP
ncbi:uncharacterized protein [Solanum lycopersicum]|uniref:uncharacterized protein n=1 Tax=Solanum lycopersicum TaxID=4081 RepID=UPI003747BE97